MNIIEILRKDPNLPRRKLVLMAGIAGLSNASILAIINSAAQSISRQESGFRLLLLFVLTLIVYSISQRYVFRMTINILETIVESIRNRISDKIRQSELVALEKLGASEIHSRLTNGTATVSQVSSVIVAGFQCALIVVFSFMYIATLSLAALMLSSVLIVAGIFVYVRRQRKIVPYIKETTRKQVHFFSMVSHILDGFVEQKLNRRRSDELFVETKSVSAELKHLKITFMDRFIANQIFSQTFMYMIMAVVVFLLPQLVATYHQEINEITATLLFIIGPLGAVVNAIPAYTNANIAIADLYELESELDSELKDWMEQGVKPEPGFLPVRELVLENVEFSYRDKEGRPVFLLGPINMSVRGGETLMIMGGNGSGKSTMFKLLVGLYTPHRGNIKVNSLLVDETRIPAYRGLFAGVLSGFHLFDRLYGFNGIEDGRVNELLQEMQMDSKTRYKNGRFTNLDLSTGQRKRLALIIALLEDHPIYVLDEWAAEQDPEFRRFFYHEILKDLKKRGKTVIAITHDEQYWHLADRVVKMDFGRIV